MKRLQWWMRIVGAFYLLLTIMNLSALILDPQLTMYQSMLPAPMTGNALAARGFADAWFAFIMELMVTGAFLLWASREPLRHLSVVWLVIWFEVFRGIVDDVFLITRGYDAMGYLGFIVVHLIIIITGVMFARQAQARTA